ncbi:MAG: immune inhibitor A [Planctomycetes bacterium]|nr:immune inhibitor A [Planctomycetota bacterium]
MQLFLLSIGMAFSLASFATAQFTPESEPRFPSTVFDFEDWKQENDGNWILRERLETRAGRFLYGGILAPATKPSSERDFVDLAFDGIDRTNSLFRIAPQTLEIIDVKLLPLSRGGIRDKVAVNLRQIQNGVPVVGGSFDLLFHTNGELVAIDSQAYPGVEDMSTNPAVGPERAAREAGRYFNEITGLPLRRITPPELVIYADLSGKLANPRLSWATEIWNEDAQLPSGRRIYVSADDGDPIVLGEDQLVHECGFTHDHDHNDHNHAHELPLIESVSEFGPQPVDFTGHVDSWATPGVKPDVGSNPEVLMPMKYMRVSSSSGNTQTDVNGDFVLPYSGTNALDLTFEYRGPYARIYNSSGTEYSYTQSFTPGVFDTAVMNDIRSQQSTAQANIYRCVIDMREWLISIDPTDDSLDFQIAANVNIGSTCNAYYNGSSINFYLAGSGCVNTAYSTVSAHEEGHWMNDLYSSGNGGDGFGEGAADIWAMFLYDTPIVGEDFCGTNCHIRTGTNTRQYCGSGCYGQVHTDGEVLMGAFWKWRDNLNTSLGNTAGDLVADTLMIGWFNGFNDGQILPVIEDHLLALDDDDGNIGNGTPNFTEIDDGFRAQGFPGVDLDFILISHNVLGDTQNEVGPYVVNANMQPQFGSVVASAEVKYTIDGGAEQTITMSDLGSGNWSAPIPGQISPTQIEYWIEAEDELGNADRYPKKSDAGFLVGLRRIAYFTDFEAAGNDGWTNEYGGGTSNDHNDWQHDSPKGQGGDPSSAYSGNLIWANDVGNSGWNGLYQSNVNIRLISPEIDCTNYSDLRLRFARWLTVESGQYDDARVRVAGNIVWANDNNIDNIDTSWQIVDYDVSDFADGNPSVLMRWELRTDGGTEFGGWNVDDVMLYRLAASGSTDTIQLRGDDMPLAGSTASYIFTNGPSNGTWVAAYSTNLNGGIYQGHRFDIGAPFTVAANGTFDAEGRGALDIPVPPGASGVSVNLEIAGFDTEGFLTDSNPLTVMVQ